MLNKLLLKLKYRIMQNLKETQLDRMKRNINKRIVWGRDGVEIWGYVRGVVDFWTDTNGFKVLEYAVTKTPSCEVPANYKGCNLVNPSDILILTY